MANGPVKDLRLGKESISRGEKDRPLYHGRIVELSSPPGVESSVNTKAGTRRT